MVIIVSAQFAQHQYLHCLSFTINLYVYIDVAAINFFAANRFIASRARLSLKSLIGAKLGVRPFLTTSSPLRLARMHDEYAIKLFQQALSLRI